MIHHESRAGRVRIVSTICRPERLYGSPVRGTPRVTSLSQGVSVTKHRRAKDWKSVMPEAQFGETFRAELLELLSWRRDVRRFRHDALPDGTFERLVQIACLAPSVGLSQP